MSTVVISIELTVTAGGLSALEPEWAATWKDTGATPFQAPAWLVPWWNAYACGQLCVIACREGRDLIGLAPLFIVQRARDGPREVRLLGTGNTDYLDVVVRPGYEHACMDAVASVLAERDDWDVCHLGNLRPSSSLLALPMAREWSHTTAWELPCPVLDLSLPLPSAVAHDVAYGLRRASRHGGVTVRHTTAETIQSDLDVLFALHAARWRQRGEPGVLQNAAARGFHRAAATRMAHASTLQLITLWIGNSPAAVQYGFVHDERAYYYLGGFDPVYSKLNAGKLAIAAAVEDARQRQAKSFDFLGGSERYKYEWGAVDQPRHRRIVRRSS
jgi:CelD/BcsL family acetyltransferase involved in cellulose biosynthesis